MNKKQIIYDEFKKMAITLDDGQLRQFEQYYDFLIEKNQVMNLTAITEFEDVVGKHFVDSVLITKVKGMSEILSKEDVRIIDVGTGAGFPGIPLKIVFPKLQVTLLDSLNKRINFLKELTDLLKIEGVSCIHGRAEDFGVQKEYREQFDFCVSRAVANLSTLSEYCVPFIKVGGLFVSYKATGAKEEIDQAKNAVKQLHCRIEIVSEMTLYHKDENYQRTFVVIKKERKLDKRFPRKSGIPSKNPLS